MRFLDLTLPTLAENLALDEALLDEAEDADRPQECLRLWESPELAVVLGRSSKVYDEVDLTACEVDRVTIGRRSSGGCAVVIGPGCLMYSLVLSYALRPHLRILEEAHRFVLGHVGQAIGTGVELRGTSDLAVDSRKFSGNSLRCKRDHLLYHGTILYDLPLDQIGRYLRQPPREPDYRQGRDHESFVANLAVDRQQLRRSLPLVFQTEHISTWPRSRVEQLVSERYGRREWTFDR